MCVYTKSSLVYTSPHTPSWTLPYPLAGSDASAGGDSAASPSEAPSVATSQLDLSNKEEEEEVGSGHSVLTPSPTHPPTR
jgi:hypothetical protein